MAANERKILTTLAIGGEKEFNAEMQKAYSNVKVLSSELKANSAEFDKNEKSVEGLTQRGKLLRQEIDQQKEIVSALSKAVDESAEAYGEDSKKTDDYRIKLNNAQAALSNMERDLKQNNETLSDAKSKTKALADGLKDFGEKAEKAGKKVEDVGNKVSVMSTAAAAAAAALVAVTTESGNWADALITQSAQTNISTETLQKWTYAAKFIDTEVDTMAKGLGKVTKATGDATAKNQDYIELAGGLKVAIKGANGELLSSEDIFYNAIDALGKMDSETQRDIASQELFGKSFQDMNPLVKAGSDELKRLGDEAETTGVIIGEDGVKQLGAYDDMMERMDAQVTTSKNKLAIQLAPTFEMIGEEITDVIGNFGEWVETLDSGTIETVLQIAAVTAVVGPLLVVIGKVSQGIGVISSALSFLVANPALLAVAAVVAITAAIVLWQASMDDSNDTAKRLSDTVKKRTQEIKDQKEAYYDLKNAQADQAEQDLAQLQNTENLRAELQNLVDAQGNVAEKDKARVSYILNEINEAYGTELTLINDNIAGYQAQMDAIDDLVEKRKYEIVQKAALPAFEKAITDEVNLRMQAERDLATLEEAKAAREAEYAELVQRYGQVKADELIAEQQNYGSWAIGISNALFGAGNDYRSLNETVSLAAENYAASTEAIKNNLSDQTTYQQAQLLAQSGNYEEAYAVLEWYSSGLAQKYQELQGDETAQRLFLENEYALADSALRTYLNNVLAGVEEYNESTVRSLTANATDLYNKAKEGGANVGDGLIAGMDEKKPGVTTSISTISDAVVSTLKSKMGIKSPSTVMKGIGENVIQGLEDGMNNRTESVSSVAASIGDLLVNTFKNIFGIQSPSTVFRDQIGKNMMLGLAGGITDNAGIVNDALNGVLPSEKNMTLDVGVIRNFYDVAAQEEPLTAGKKSTKSSIGTYGETSKNVTIAPVYIYNADDTSYAEQERIRDRQTKALVRELSMIEI